MTGDRLKAYLEQCNREDARLLVVGHPAPDTDAVVSALFEAWRLTLSGTPATPALQGKLPREAAYLLGDAAERMPVVTALDPTVPLVLTDHHDLADYRNPVAAILDHHPLTSGTDLTGIHAEILPVGAATTLVARRIRRDGITPDAACARILLGAILLDTEGLSPHKAKAEDIDTVAWLYSLCGEDPHGLFADLREQLLSETDVAVLYERDYRRYTDGAGRPFLGWAILKVWADACPDIEAVRRLLEVDTAAPTRVAKLVLHSREKDTRTEFYLAAGEAADPLLTLVQTSAGEDATRLAPDMVYLPETCIHWGRKRYATKIQELWSRKD